MGKLCSMPFYASIYLLCLAPLGSLNSWLCCVWMASRTPDCQAVTVRRVQVADSGRRVPQRVTLIFSTIAGWDEISDPVGTPDSFSSSLSRLDLGKPLKEFDLAGHDGPLGVRLREPQNLLGDDHDEESPDAIPHHPFLHLTSPLFHIAL